MSSQLRDLIKQAPISQIVGNFIPLKRSGSGLVGLCPFHPDSKPSMTVNDKLGLWRCWPCDRGGDALTFVQDFKKIEFIEAMRLCAQILGLPEDELNKERKKNPRLELGFRVLNFANRLYTHVAQQEPMHFVKFVKDRELSQESITQFQIGYAPGNNALMLQFDKVPSDQQEAAKQMARELNLVRVSEGGRPYDFYRDRVVFPIHDHAGQVRGFTCRAVLKDQNPKFLNSSDSFVFHKASILYGYFLAKSAIRQNDRVILAEGNMDVVMMHQFGFTETVGTMGVALSESSLRLLMNMTKNVILAMDSDAAGIKAMTSINAAFMNQGILPRFLSFAPAKDPDEFLRTEGRLALMERIEKAPRFIDYLLDQLIPNPIPETIDLKLQLMKETFELLSPLKDHLEATERVIGVAKRLQVRTDETSLIDHYKLSLKNQETQRMAPRAVVQTTENKDEEESEDSNSQELSTVAPLVKEEMPPMFSGEKLLLKTLMTHPECLSQPQLHEILAYISHPEVKTLILWLTKIYLEIDEQEYVSILSDEVFSEKYGREIKGVAAEALEHYKLEPLNDKVVTRLLQDLKIRMQLEQMRQKRKELTELQKQSQTEEEVVFYMQEITKLDRDLQELKKNPF
ncbi:MAG: DNA primase [Bacteriovoracaceae bacterium]|nr:DNA primase [Bacteriovoracaceae bacterium]